MDDKIIKVGLGDEFKICPACGYEDGFHSMFKRDNAVVSWLFICPACHQIFDVGLTVPQPAVER